MPVDGAAKTKSRKKSLRAAQEETAELGKDDRVLELRLRANTRDAKAVPEATLQHLLHTTFGSEESVVRLGDAVARAASGSGDTAAAGASAAHLAAGDVDALLIRHRIRVDLPTLTRLLAADAKYCVALFEPPAATTAAASASEESAGAVASGRAPASNAKAGAKVRRKASVPAATVHDLTGPRLGAADAYMLDIMHTMECTYPLAPNVLPGLHDARVVLCCRGGCLAPPVVLRRLRPVCVTVDTVDCMAAAGQKASPVTVALELFGHHIRTPPLPCCTSSVKAAAGEKGVPLFRTVRFLGDLPPLSVYQRAMLEPLRVIVQRTEAMRMEGVSATILGVGSFTMRDLVTDGQTYFSEAVSLLPAARSGSGCLTAASTVVCTVDFLLPLPPLVHVNAVGAPAPRSALMTRGLVVLPYAARWMPAVLACLLQQLMQSRRATIGSDVQLYEEPPPPPPPPPVADGEEGGGGVNAADGAAGQKAAAIGSTARTDGAKHNRASVGSATAAIGADGEDPANAPPPMSSWPFAADSVRVMSPEGISGFEVADGERRLICLEGPAGEVHRILTALNSTVTTAASCTATGSAPPMHLLFNPELFAVRRLYVSYPPLVTPPAGRATSHRSGPREPTLVAGTADDDEDNAVDEMGGGCGGRLHRIRLREPLSSLMAQQPLLLRRTLSEACLRCILQLDSLARCATLHEAIVRDLFPCAADLISLERSFGQTLELPDIFGSDAYVSSDAPLSDTTGGAGAAGAITPEVEKQGDGQDVFDVAAALRLPAAQVVGHLVAFDGTLLRGRRQRVVPAAVIARYPRTLWMQSQAGVKVLCAFPSAVPTGTVRYHVEGQVVEAGGTRLLYALACHTLAKSFTSSRNAPYTQALAARRREEHQQRLAHSRLRGGADMAGGGASAAVTGLAEATCSKSHYVSNIHGSSSDDDDAACPPRDDVLDDVAAPPLAYAGAGTAAGGLAVGDTRTSLMRTAAGRSARKGEQDVDYELLWDIYKKRAPKTAV